MHFSFDWSRDLQDVIKILIAYLLVLPICWYREREAHSVGVRTFPVVAMASCGYVLLGAASAHMSTEAQSRIIQGLVAGIGFIGGGRNFEVGEPCSWRRHGREHLEHGCGRGVGCP